MTFCAGADRSAKDGFASTVFWSCRVKAPGARAGGSRQEGFAVMEETGCTELLGEEVELRESFCKPPPSLLHTDYGAHAHPANTAEVSENTIKRETILK